MSKYDERSKLDFVGKEILSQYNFLNPVFLIQASQNVCQEPATFNQNLTTTNYHHYSLVNAKLEFNFFLVSDMKDKRDRAKE